MFYGINRNGKKVDLNSDIGESFGAYTIGMDEEVLTYVTSANVACGFHAGDPLVMEKTVFLAKIKGVKVGAHPGFNDLQGFGRRNMSLSEEDLKAMVKYQIGALNAFCMSNDIKMQHVKPHGAMYNMAAKDKKIARAIAEAIYEVDQDLYLLGLSGSLMIDAAKEVGIRVKSEVFADRAYESDGTLVSRTKPGAVIKDEELMKKRVLQMVTEGTVESVDGVLIPIAADSICVHGDNEKAVSFTREIRNMLIGAGVTVASFDD